MTLPGRKSFSPLWLLSRIFQCLVLKPWCTLPGGRRWWIIETFARPRSQRLLQPWSRSWSCYSPSPASVPGSSVSSSGRHWAVQFAECRRRPLSRSLLRQWGRLFGEFVCSGRTERFPMTRRCLLMWEASRILALGTIWTLWFFIIWLSLLARREVFLVFSLFW